jgi:hypothetical protein
MAKKNQVKEVRFSTTPQGTTVTKGTRDSIASVLAAGWRRLATQDNFERTVRAGLEEEVYRL